MWKVIFFVFILIAVWKFYPSTRPSFINFEEARTRQVNLEEVRKTAIDGFKKEKIVETVNERRSEMNKAAREQLD